MRKYRALITWFDSEKPYSEITLLDRTFIDRSTEILDFLMGISNQTKEDLDFIRATIKTIEQLGKTKSLYQESEIVGKMGKTKKKNELE